MKQLDSEECLKYLTLYGQKSSKKECLDKIAERIIHCHVSQLPK